MPALKGHTSVLLLTFKYSYKIKVSSCLVADLYLDNGTNTVSVIEVWPITHETQC